MSPLDTSFHEFALDSNCCFGLAPVMICVAGIRFNFYLSSLAAASHLNGQRFSIYGGGMVQPVLKPDMAGRYCAASGSLILVITRTNTRENLGRSILIKRLI